MYPLVSNLSPRQENRWSVTIKVVQENRGIVTIKEVQENRRGVTIKEVQKNRISVTRAGRDPCGMIVLSREWTEQSRTIPSFQKKNWTLRTRSKNIGTISIRMEQNRNCLERTVKIVNTFLFSRMLSKLGKHFNSGMCFQFRFSLYVVNRNGKIKWL